MDAWAGSKSEAEPTASETPIAAPTATPEPSDVRKPDEIAAHQVVVLDDGSELRGRVVGIVDDVLTLDTALGILHIPMARVQSIGVPAPQPTPPPAPSRRSSAERHTGFNYAWNTGLQVPFGQAYGRFLPGPAQKFDIGGRITPEFSLETGFAFASGDVDEPDSSQAVWIHFFTLDGRYFFSGAREWEPNLLLGLAVATGVNWESDGFELGYSGNSYQLGFGVRMHKNHRYYLNLDVRYVYTRITRASIGELGFAANLEGNLLQFMVGIGKQR